MKRIIRIVGCVLLAAALASPAWAKPGNGKGGGGGGGGSGGSGDPGESQAGGLPGLEDRVDVIDMEIATLTTEVGTLTTEVNTLITEVATLTNSVNELEIDVTDLEGQNNFAVVSAACAIISSSSSAGPVTATPIGIGTCQVTFSKDVHLCSAVATPQSVGVQIGVVSSTKTTAGDSFTVATDFPAGTPLSEAFNLTVTCP